jgi:ATP-binding cassette subfamily G (WHITE) protein 2
MTNVTFTATGLGILIGCLFNDIEVALNAAPLFFFPMMLFSGFYVNSESVRDFVKWLEWISPLRYGLEAGIYNEFEDTNFVPNPITSFNFDYGYWKSMLFLIIIGMSIRVISFIALFINARRA